MHMVIAPVGLPGMIAALHVLNSASTKVLSGNVLLRKKRGLRLGVNELLS